MKITAKYQQTHLYTDTITPINHKRQAKQESEENQRLPQKPIIIKQNIPTYSLNKNNLLLILQN